jgi:hypothetical protein
VRLGSQFGSSHCVACGLEQQVHLLLEGERLALKIEGGAYTPPESVRTNRRISRHDVRCISFSYIKEGPREERST